MATSEQGLISERNKLKSAIARETNVAAKQKLIDEDLALRDQLAGLYAQADPTHAQARAQAHQAMANFQRFGNTAGRKPNNFPGF